MESYIVQLYVSAAFDRVNHSGLSSKLKSIGLGGCVLSICREFLSNRINHDSSSLTSGGFRGWWCY